ncbi:hypothetical protein FSARC_8190 [Fusarium sarcochroum]|uniref:Uncharacterized protein n=1 Tax=Fusarium sarcochroum TaxID=1208366 RepID=A0A8H4X769_9HYPO|nr:hypothetical protein FSARC_8190 [Fusarium sarcochroum]
MAPNDIVPLKPKQKRRLYEPVIMYKSLTEITHEEGALRSAEVPDRPGTEEQRYHRFLHRIASVCDSTKGGKTVTSVTILDGEERFTYVFGCNQISIGELSRTQKFVTDLLRKLSGFDKLKDYEKTSVRSDVLKMILIFNLPRIDCYLRDLKNQLVDCLDYCERKTDAKGTDSAVGRGLRAFNRAIKNTAFKELADSQFLVSYDSLLQSLATFLTPQTTRYVDEHANTGRFNDGRSFECWSELRHSISRLRNYKRTVQDLVDAEKEWPELFQEFAVISVPSSKPEGNPLGKKSETADAIIGRMCSDETSQTRYRNLAQNLQGMDLDARIQKQCTKTGFKPFVHSEILVLEWIVANTTRHNLHNATRDHIPFFRDWKYIGSSKGACQLCRYYFDTIGQHNGIQTRASHGNLYVNWRFPDLYEVDGALAKTRRQMIYNSMMGKIREDAFGILVSRNSEGKRHDSSTHPLSVRHTDVQTDLGARDLPDVDELGEDLARGLSLGDSPTNSLEESDLDDEEEGGTSLG